MLVGDAKKRRKSGRGRSELGLKIAMEEGRRTARRRRKRYLSIQHKTLHSNVINKAPEDDEEEKEAKSDAQQQKFFL